MVAVTFTVEAVHGLRTARRHDGGFGKWSPQWKQSSSRSLTMVWQRGQTFVPALGTAGPDKPPGGTGGIA